jgi:hypothetical protein
MQEVNGYGDGFYERRNAVKKSIQMVSNQQEAIYGWNIGFF